MIVYEIPIAIFIKRLNSLKEKNNDPHRIVDLLLNLISVANTNDKITSFNTFDATTLVVSGVILDFHNESERIWLNKYLVYRPTESELEELEKAKYIE